MAMRLLSYPLLTVALLLAVFTVAHVAFAERPDDCAPEDREISGNTNSPCKWNHRFDEIISVSYEVVENTEGNTCHEVLIFSPYDGQWDVTREVAVRMWLGKKNKQGGTFRNIDLQQYYDRGISSEFLQTVGTIPREFVSASGNSITVIPGHSLAFYSVDSRVPERTDWGSTLYKED